MTDKEIDNFLKDLVFAVNQPNEIRLGELISEELGAEFNLIDSDLITSDFQNKILGWLKEKQGSYLSENKIDGFFKEMGAKISQLVLMGPTAEYTQKLQEYGIVFDDKDFYVKLKEFLNPSSSQSIFNLTVKPKLTLFGSIKINQEMTSKSRGSYIFIRLSSLIRLKDEVLLAFRKNENNLLIIECKSEPTKEDVQELYNKLSKVLFEETKGKKVIFISTRDNPLVSKFKDRKEYQEIVDKIEFSQLSVASQQKLLAKRVNFQGSEINLNQLINTELSLTD